MSVMIRHLSDEREMLSNGFSLNLKIKLIKGIQNTNVKYR